MSSSQKQLRGAVRLGSIHIRWLTHMMVRQEAGPREQWPRGLKGDYQAQFHSGLMVLMVVKREAELPERWPKTLK